LFFADASMIASLVPNLAQILYGRIIISYAGSG
jgi:hypothetical protein